MPSRSRQNRKPASDSKSEAEKILEMMYLQGKAQFGNAMKSFWLNDGNFCPGCLARPIDRIKFKGKEDALSINGFMYRPRGVLIGYFLCEVCAGFIFTEAEKHPYKQTSLHTEIDQFNRCLSQAFVFVGCVSKTTLSALPASSQG